MPRYSAGFSGSFSFVRPKALKQMEAALLVVLDVVSFVAILGLFQWLYHSRISIEMGGVPYVISFLVIIIVVNSVFDLYSTETNHILPLSSHWILTPFVTMVSFFIMISLIYFLGVERFAGSYFGRGILMGTMTGFAVTSTVYRFALYKVLEGFKMRQHYLLLAKDKTLEVIMKENKKSFRKNNLRNISLRDFEAIDNDSSHDLGACAWNHC